MPRTCLCLVSVFRRRTVFKLLTSKKFTEATEKSLFQKSDPLREKIQNFATGGFMRTLVNIFLPSFTEIGKAEVTKRVRGIHHEKKVRSLPFLWGFWSDLPKNFTGSLFPYTYINAYIIFICSNNKTIKQDMKNTW